MVLDALFGVGPPRHRCALAVHIGRLYTALAIAQGDRQVKMRSICSWFSMPSFASDPPSLSSRRPPLGRLYRSCHRTERLFKLKCAHRALMVLDAHFGVGPPPPRCTRPSTSDVFTALAIVQGDCSSRDALLLRSRCPSLASGRRRCCALAVHIGRLYRSRHYARRSFKSRCARTLMVLDALFGVRPP